MTCPLCGSKLRDQLAEAVQELLDSPVDVRAEGGAVTVVDGGAGWYVDADGVKRAGLTGLPIAPDSDLPTPERSGE